MPIVSRSTRCPRCLTIRGMHTSFRCPECEKSRFHIVTICPRCGASVLVSENGFARHWMLILFILALAAVTVFSALQAAPGR